MDVFTRINMMIHVFTYICQATTALYCISNYRVASVRNKDGMEMGRIVSIRGNEIENSRINI